MSSFKFCEIFQNTFLQNTSGQLLQDFRYVSLLSLLNYKTRKPVILKRLGVDAFADI